MIVNLMTLMVNTLFYTPIPQWRKPYVLNHHPTLLLSPFLDSWLHKLFFNTIVTHKGCSGLWSFATDYGNCFISDDSQLKLMDLPGRLQISVNHICKIFTAAFLKNKYYRAWFILWYWLISVKIQKRNKLCHIRHLVRLSYALK